MTYTVGDKGVPLSGVCTDGGSPVNISGCSVELHIRKPGGVLLIKNASVTDGTSGAWVYNFASGDLDTAGTHQVEAQITSSDNFVIQTFGPADMEVQDQLG